MPLFFLCAQARAEGQDGYALASLGTDFFTWESLGTFSGAVSLVVFLVQALKLPVDGLWKTRTHYLAYFLSLTILLLAEYFLQNGLGLSEILLAALNALLVTMSAMTLYEKFIRGVEERSASIKAASKKVYNK